ncbi:hypothetical protein CM49_01569 [Paenibacillus sp. P1XP2]|nr:hypothetical protein CM49_01569 [Paenibacillus sp. P1XP2]
MESKRKRKTKASALLLVSALFVGLLAGCGGSGGNGAASKENGSGKEAAAGNDNSPITFSLFSADRVRTGRG